MARPDLAPLATVLPLLLALAGSCGPGVDPTPVPTPTLGDEVDGAFTDADGDGYVRSDDCDDEDASTWPGAPEACDAADNDCDTTVDEGFDQDGDGHLSQASCAALGGDDCDDADPFTFPSAPESCDGGDDDCDQQIDEDPEGGTFNFYPDADGDGLGDGANPTRSCTDETPEGHVDNNLDCDDTDAEVGRPAPWYLDGDGDGFGPTDTLVRACTSPGEGYVDAGGDCADADPDIAPDSSERCDGVDEDCDDRIDEGVQTPYYLDDDGDGFGTDDSVVEACAAPSEDYVVLGGDCDDTRTNVNPGMTDFCDDIDNDCDEEVDEPDNQSIPWWYLDSDGDGFGDPEQRMRSCDQPANHVDNNDDCDDKASGVNPDATEVCGDTIDQDCSGADLPCP